MITRYHVSNPLLSDIVFRFLDYAVSSGMQYSGFGCKN